MQCECVYEWVSVSLSVCAWICLCWLSLLLFSLFSISFGFVYVFCMCCRMWVRLSLLTSYDETMKRERAQQVDRVRKCVCVCVKESHWIVFMPCETAKSFILSILYVHSMWINVWRALCAACVVTMYNVHMSKNSMQWMRSLSLSQSLSCSLFLSKIQKRLKRGNL